MLELFKNAAKIKQYYDEGKYLKAAELLARTVAALLGEFTEGADGALKVKGAKTAKASDAKNLEKAEAVLAELQSAPRPVGADPAGNPWLSLVLTLLPVVLDLIRRRRDRQG